LEGTKKDEGSWKGMKKRKKTESRDEREGLCKDGI